MISLLGGTATLGIALQAVVLLVFWRRTGLALKPDFRWRGVGLGTVGRLAGWTFLMAFASLAAGTLQGFIVSEAAGLEASATVTTNAWLIFMLPYSVIVLSIGTPTSPRSASTPRVAGTTRSAATSPGASARSSSSSPPPSPPWPPPPCRPRGSSRRTPSS